MIRSREILPPSLQHALVANRVLTALERLERGTDDDKKEALSAAVSFLTLILHGRNLTKRLEVQENSYQAGVAYSEALRAIELLPQRDLTKDAGDCLNRLAEIAKALSEDRAVESDSIRALTAFFRSVREIALASSSRKLEKVQYVG